MSDLQTRLQAAVGDTYRIESELGGGGMSRVFLAEEVRLERKVVIKLLPPEMGAGVNVERFEREIKLAAKLQHPHIVPLLTAGNQDDLLWYVMPYIEGESMRAKLAREGELPIGEAVRILKEVIDALQYAHSNKVVHRDIKPDNVMLSGKHAVVTDFGVAKAVSASTGESNLTSLGVALGTPAYMSPEQAAADPHVDHRADIYAIGAMAYEMLTGRPPFIGTNAQQVLVAHMTNDPDPVTQHRGTVPPGLNEIILRCLHKKPADRFQRAEEMIPHLDAILTPSGGMTPTGTQPVQAIDYDAKVKQAHPMRVAGLYALASVGALAIVYMAMNMIGLPSWVFSGAVGLLAIGLPIVLLTGHRERQRAVATMTGVQVPTPVGLQKHFTWRKAILGGVAAFGGLAVITTAFMGSRLLGIGPGATLVSSGVLEERDPIIVAQFTNNTADSALGATITEALRIDLGQSPVVKLVERADLTPALERMGREPTTVVNAAVASEIAQREGYKAFIDGEVSPLGSGYVLSARVVLAETGETLVPVRENAEDDTKLIGAVEKLSAKLREGIGESLRSIRTSVPLETVSTSSLEALKLYTRAVAAEEVGDWERAIDLLEEAIAADSMFASAYRFLAINLSNNRRERSRILWAGRRAYELRDRLPPYERYRATANYFEDVEPNADEALRAYESALELRPEAWGAWNNAGLLLNQQRKYADAVDYFRQANSAEPSWQSFGNLANTLVLLGKSDEADSVIAAYTDWSPNHPELLELLTFLAQSRGEYERADSLADVLDANRRHDAAMFHRATLAEARGALADARRILDEWIAEAVQDGNERDALGRAVNLARMELRYGDGPEAAARVLDQILEDHPLSTLDPSDWPVWRMAEIYADAGNPDGVRDVRKAREPSGGLSPSFAHRFDALEATAEGRFLDAAAAYQQAYAAHGNPVRDLPEMARAYDRAGQTDSARAVFERAVTIPFVFANAWIFDEWAAAYKRLGELYEGVDRRRAIEYYNAFVDHWASADQELQPLVADVRARIARLVGESR